MAHTARLLIRDVVTASKTETVLDAAKKMKAAGVGCVAVTEGKTLAGIFSERDILNRVVSAGKDPSKTSLADVMTPNPVTVDAAQPLDRVFAILAERRFRHVPITDGAALVGMVSLSDLAVVLKEVYREDRYLQYFVDFVESSQTAGPASGESPHKPARKV